mmetsp:Transcript_115389/g.366991  ORF Transcript_115389/g.366991 Transcript_115389/m.366991 type:complete len:233 (+) Transcript_115389:579-1277(+)
MPVAKAKRITAFSEARRGQASRRSMTFCTTLQTFPSAVSRALAIMPRTWASSGSPAGSSETRTARSATSRTAAGSWRRRHVCSSSARSSTVVTDSRTKVASSGISSSNCSIEATCTSRSAPVRSVTRQTVPSPCSATAPSLSAARRPSSARRTPTGQPIGKKTLTRSTATEEPAPSSPPLPLPSPPLAVPGGLAAAAQPSRPLSTAPPWLSPLPPPLPLPAGRHSAESAETT